MSNDLSVQQWILRVLRAELCHLGDICSRLGMKASEKVWASLGEAEEEGKIFGDYDDIKNKVLMAIMHPNVSLVGIAGLEIDEEPPVVEVD